MLKIGIFGGCFNPPHKMHENIAKELIEKNELDKIVFVPTGNSYNKKGLVDIQKRVDMLNLIFEENQNILVSDISSNENYTYTYQVLDYFKSQNINCEIYFICGTDNLKEFKTWRRFEYILQNYNLMVVARDRDDIDEILISEFNEYKDKIHIVDMGFNPDSSTIVRNYIKQDRYDELDSLMDIRVLKYITDRNMYKGS